MIEAVREVLVLILHTKEGSKVALHCLWHGTPKVLVVAHSDSLPCLIFCHLMINALAQDRKVIVKSMKGLVKNICKVRNDGAHNHIHIHTHTHTHTHTQEEHGVVAMLGLFDCVDDTVLVKKALLSVRVCVWGGGTNRKVLVPHTHT